MTGLNSDLQADLLKAVGQAAEAGEAAAAGSLAERLGRPAEAVAGALAELEAAGLVTQAAAAVELTESGRRQTLALTRAHRLIEAYLRERDGLPLEQVHAEADRLEHVLSPLEVERIARQLNHPRFDPHGDPIPTRAGELPAMGRVPLPEWPVGVEGRIAHLEDEPPEDCAALLAAGLARGARMRRLGPEGERERLWVHGKKVEIPARLGARVAVEPLAAGERGAADCRTLAEFAPGEAAEIVELHPALIGPARHRLLDLGLVPGTRVVPDFSAPLNGPRTYQIRGTMIALRRAQADGILVRPAAGLKDGGAWKAPLHGASHAKGEAGK